ncbi:7 transmembrane receptor (rhodopsin family) [Popillia japonica]|uniref:7 transmembrane receptor (Rhodopsin family) n=1 Tax=Popillia japonica TaxID=7064 RepID=A0AAW1ITU6_POPJA
MNTYTIISYYPYYSKLYSKISILIQLLFIWAGSFLIMLPPLLGIWGQLGLHPSTFSCTILEKNGKSPKKFIFLVGFALPCVVIIISYICIYLKVKKSTKKLRKHQVKDSTRNKNSRREREDGRLTKLMLLIFVCFVFCFLPLMCVNVFDDEVRYPTLHVFASILAWASSVVNPFIYAASNRQYRSAYSKLFNVFRSSVTPTDSRQLSNSQKSRGTENKNNHQLVKVVPGE